MPMTAQEALRRLIREGWKVAMQTGSHIQLVKDGTRLTLPYHKGDLSSGVDRDVKRKAG